MSDAPDPITPPEGSAPEGDAPKTFTQEDLQRIARQEKASGRKAAEAELLQKLGIDDADAAAALIAEAQQRRDAEKTEAQRAQEAAEAARKDADTERQAALADRHSVKVERQLLRAGVATERLDRVTRLVTANPGASDEDIASEVETIKEEFPELFGSSAPPKLRTPDSYVPGKPPVSKPAGEDPRDAAKRRAEAYNAKHGVSRPA